MNLPWATRKQRRRQEIGIRAYLIVIMAVFGLWGMDAPGKAQAFGAGVGR